MTYEATNYHQDGIIVENSLIRNRKDSKEVSRKMNEKKSNVNCVSISFDVAMGTANSM